MTVTDTPLRVGIAVADLAVEGAPHNYIRQLIKALAEHPHVEPVVIYVEGGETIDESIARIQFDRGQYPTPILPNRPMLPHLPSVEQSHDIDLFHLNKIPDLTHFSVARTQAPVVATVHGTLHWERIPAEEQPRNYRIRRRLFDRLGRYTLDCVLPVSNYVRQLLIQRAGYSQNKVRTTYEAIHDRFFTSEHDQLSDVSQPYLLHVSSYAPKKNVITLLRAFAHRPHQQELSLEIAGPGWQEQCGELASELGIADQVRFRGYVPIDDLLALYDHAACFVYPSYHETFGLPNIEAMARGAPVVTSSRFAIPEIVHNAAHMVGDPGDPEELSNAIGHVLNEEDYRNRLIKSGRQRAQQFRWSVHVELLLDAYRSVLTP